VSVTIPIDFCLICIIAFTRVRTLAALPLVPNFSVILGWSSIYDRFWKNCISDCWSVYLNRS
jgi:hypothetical protein